MTPCLICTDEGKRTEAARRFAAGESLRTVADAIGVSKSALDRCKRNHGLGQGEGVSSTEIPSEVAPCVPSGESCPKLSVEKRPESVAENGATADEARNSRDAWRVIAPTVRFLRADGTPSTATAGEVVTDVHVVFVKALMAARVLVPTRKHPAPEGGSDA